MNIKELEEAIYGEWGNLHHNASMSRVLYRSKGIDFKNEYESELFFSVVGMNTEMWIENLTDMIKEKFDYTLKFYSYGRQGATIAPDTWMRSAACNGFGGFDSYVLPQYGYGLDDYNEMYSILNTLRYINTYWNGVVDHLPEWWKETKEMNEYQEDIDNHEGMTLVNRYVWELS